MFSYLQCFLYRLFHIMKCKRISVSLSVNRNAVEGCCDAQTDSQGTVTAHHSEADHGSRVSPFPGLSHLSPPSFRSPDHHRLVLPPQPGPAEGFFTSANQADCWILALSSSQRAQRCAYQSYSSRKTDNNEHSATGANISPTYCAVASFFYICRFYAEPQQWANSNSTNCLQAQD